MNISILSELNHELFNYMHGPCLLYFILTIQQQDGSGYTKSKWLSVLINVGFLSLNIKINNSTPQMSNTLLVLKIPRRQK